MPRPLANSFQNSDVNLESLSLLMTAGRPFPVAYQESMKCFAETFAESVLQHGTKHKSLVNLSIMSITESNPDVDFGKDNQPLDTCWPRSDGMGRGWRKPYYE